MGLQIPDPRFESGCRLQTYLKAPGWRNGRRKGLKILRTFVRAGSSPALGTKVVIIINNNEVKKIFLTKLILVIKYDLEGIL
jgi:hypothetical protein